MKHKKYILNYYLYFYVYLQSYIILVCNCLLVRVNLLQWMCIIIFGALCASEHITYWVYAEHSTLTDKSQCFSTKWQFKKCIKVRL